MIGEKLSGKLLVDDVIYDLPSRRFYANTMDLTLQRPLDFGLLIYYKLWLKFYREDAIEEMEVYHDHRKQRLVAAVIFKCGPHKIVKKARHVVFGEHEASAPDHIEALIDERMYDLYKMYKEACQ